VGSPTIACPSSFTFDSLDGSTIVTYAAPTVTGGSNPVQSSCTIPSGNAFPPGSTDVVCTATDAVGRSASCTFQVTVRIAYKLQGTKFMAFGDSFTEGDVEPPRTFVIMPSVAYPKVLQDLLQARYFTQMPTVTPAGVSGELASDGAARLRDLLLQGPPPDALLVLEGINDINKAGVSAIPSLIEGLKADIRYAGNAGVKIVFLSTILPEDVFAKEAVEPANDAIRDLAAAEGAVLVDNWAAFVGSTDTLLGFGGLHPTEAGHQVIAQTFFDAIKANFELPPGSSVSRRR
jgi:lysophospholipase L1-like esterase